MPDESSQANRYQAIGALLRQARQAAAKSRRECALVLGCTPQLIAEFENGETEITVTQLEVLAQLFGLPVTHFLQTQAPAANGLAAEEEQEEPVDLVEAGMMLRQKLNGVQLRQARLGAGKSQKDCAKLLGCAVRRICKK